MCFTEENFQRISEDLADFYTEIPLCMKEAGKKKSYMNVRQNHRNTAHRVRKGEEINPRSSDRAEGFKNLAWEEC